MTILTDTPLRVADVSEATGLSGHTLRFYEKEGLLTGLPVERNGSGHRVYTEQRIEWLRVCSKLRSSGMPLSQIRRYAELFAEGSHSVPERHQILRDHEDAVRRQMADLQEALDVIEHKVAFTSSAWPRAPRTRCGATDRSAQPERPIGTTQPTGVKRPPASRG